MYIYILWYSGCGGRTRTFVLRVMSIWALSTTLISLIPCAAMVCYHYISILPKHILLIMCKICNNAISYTNFSTPTNQHPPGNLPKETPKQDKIQEPLEHPYSWSPCILILTYRLLNPKISPKSSFCVKSGTNQNLTT